MSDIADAWLTYAADSSLLSIAQGTVTSAQKSVKLTRARLEGGIAPRTDLRQAEQVLENAKADAADQRTALAQDVNLLRLLVGAEVDPKLLPASIDQAAPTVAELPAGLDSQILLRRPDVVEAEYQLRAANAQIGAARAALFPRISLTGLLGLASSALTGLFSGGSFAWSAGADATYTIFQAGAGRANVRLTEAQKACRRRHLSARDPAGLPRGRRRTGAPRHDRRTTPRSPGSARGCGRHLSPDRSPLSERYRQLPASLDAQRSYYAAQRTLVLSRLEAATNLVDLYRSLGGDSLLTTTPDA